MGSHRVRSNSNAAINTPTKHQRQRPYAPQTPQALGPRKESNLGMSPASRYNHNLKVLRRRDPSILSIFDQFSHVCVYHHNGNKWEKQGFEGSMFLYERDSYPPYGFYILNRMGMDDYIQRLYPEDDIGAHGSYLMMRCYPDFTARRLATAHATVHNASQIPHKFADVYAIQAPEKLLDKDKGHSQIVGLWMFATDAREPMIDVMLRLHSFIKRNLPYPEEFRYGPDRPPPPNPHLRIGSPSPSSEEGNNSVSSPSLSCTLSDTHQSQRPHATSELDLLFAKLDPARSVTNGILGSTSTPQPPISTSKMSVESLFSALGGTQLGSGSEKQTGMTSPAPVIPNRGLALLDSIFASATPSPENSRQNGIEPSHTQNMNSSVTSFTSTFSSSTTTRLPYNPAEANARLVTPSQFHSSELQLNAHFDPLTSQPFHSRSSSSCSDLQPYEPLAFPKPVSALPQPQVLTQDVISGLLGLAPEHISSQSFTHSRSSSTSTTSSRLSRYSGDAEDEDEGGPADSDAYSGYSRPSTVFDTDADAYEEIPAAEISDGQSLPPSINTQGANVSTLGRVNGDVTPRAPWRGPLFGGGPGVQEYVRERRCGGMKTSSPPPPDRPPKSHHIPITNSSSSSSHVTSPPPPSVINPSTSTDTVRSSIARIATSSSISVVAASQTPSEAQAPQSHSLIPIIADSELWPDSRVPIDDRALDDDTDIVELDFADTSALSDAEAFMSKVQEREKRRETARGQLAESQSVQGKNGRETAHIIMEKRGTQMSHDVPAQDVKPAVTLSTPVGVTPKVPYSVTTTTSSPAIVLNECKVSKNPQTVPPIDSTRRNHLKLDRVNSKAPTNGHEVGVDRNAVQQSILAVTSSGRLRSGLERNEFVRQVLALVHTDKTFVDNLWQEYMSRM